MYNYGKALRTTLRKRQCFFILVFCGFVTILAYISLGLISQDGTCMGRRCFKYKQRQRAYFRDHEEICVLPKLHPFGKPLVNLSPNNTKDPRNICPEVAKNFELVNGRIWPRGDSLPENILKRSVKYEVVVRLNGHDDDISLGPEVFIFKNNQNVHRIQSDFVMVSYKLEDQSRHVEMFAQIARKSQLSSVNNKNALNVLVMGFDSTSSANFQRQLPESFKFLVSELDAAIFNGYSIVGDGTTPALTAMLTGVSLRTHMNNNTSTLDEWPWIMKDYKKEGYATLYAEDDPHLACFNNFKLGGFRLQPADHYIRPFWLSVEQHGRNGRKRNKTDALHRVCFNSEALHNITLDYTAKFFRAYRNVPKFAFNYFSYLPHGTGENLNFADLDLLQFLRRFEMYRKNSILIMFGDHGARIGPFRNTVQGSYEEHLPWLSIVTPSWFKDKYPKLMDNLKKNRDILTTPFDVHHTLHHILNLDESPDGTSLFSPLNPKRSCSEAGVDVHWCPCLVWTKVDISSPYVQAAAHLMLEKINKILKRKALYVQLCFTLYLVDILLATKANTGQSNTYYQVTIATNPGGGSFQGTFYVDQKRNLVINQHISRTNQYGRNPWCLHQKDRSLRKFCTCKKPLPGRREARNRLLV